MIFSTLVSATLLASSVFGYAPESLGTGAPPATYKTYTMSPNQPEGSPILSFVTEAPGLNGANPIKFDRPVQYRQVPSTWSTWSHGYTGPVYYEGGVELEMTIPDEVCAFIFYLEPNAFSSFNFNVSFSDGYYLNVNVNGLAGAVGIAVAKDAVHGFPKTINIYNTDLCAGGFAVGEFKLAACDICEEHLDIVFVLDESGSVGSTNFNKVKNFVVDQITNKIDEESNIGVVSFSNQIQIDHSLGDTQTPRTQLLSTVNGLSHSGGQTYTDSAVQKAIDDFTANDDPTKQNVMVLVTDGVPYPSTRSPCGLKATLDGLGVKTYVVGVGSFDTTKVDCLVDDVSNDMILLDNFDELDSIQIPCPQPSCDVDEWCKRNIGDGKCHGVTNNAGCGWDGGDCCEESCNHPNCGLFWGYDCKDPKYNPYAPECTANYKLIGDGLCHGSTNVPECGYDGGDCCESTCQGINCGAWGYPCLDPNA